MKPKTLSNLFTASALAAALTLMSLSRCTDISVSPPDDMIITYNLKVESGSGGSVSPTTQNNIAAGTPISVKATPNNGYAFSKWSLTRGLAQFADANSAATSVLLGWNATIKADFISIYTVMFNINGATGTTPESVSQIIYGNSIRLPGKGDMVKTGYKSPDTIKYTFGGWNTNSAGTGTNYGADSIYRVTSNVTLYARWIPICTVKFNINNATSGEAPTTITADSGKSITLPGKGDLARDGYSFAGWADGTGTNYNAGASYFVRNNITLYAKWLPIYAVTFDGNGNTSGSAPAIMRADSGKSITLPSRGYLTRSGYYFDGWNDKSDGTGTNYNAGASYSVRNNITLYAKWSDVYVVYFNGNGATSGSAPAAMEVMLADSDKSITLPNSGTLTRDGYSFSGWDKYPAGSSYTVTGNVTLYARWTTSFTDSRDGKTYKAVVIGEQAWMAENLNYQTSSGSWCPSIVGWDGDSYCDKYGRFYNWTTAMGIDTSYNNRYWDGGNVKQQGICPYGWHLPSRDEWNTLVEYVGGQSVAGKKLKVGSWPNGGDDYGFSALPSGMCYNGELIYENYASYWWTATGYDSYSAVCRYINNMNGDYGNKLGEYNESKRKPTSVRCVQD